MLLELRDLYKLFVYIVIDEIPVLKFAIGICLGFAAVQHWGADSLNLAFFFVMFDFREYVHNTKDYILRISVSMFPYICHFIGE